MNTNTSPSRDRLATGTANGTKAYDEERIEWAAASRSSTWTKKYLRFPRPRRVVFCLLLIDLIIVGVLVRAFEPLITLLRRNEELFGARLSLSRNDPLDEGQHLEQHMIPRILHQTSATYKIPDEWIQSQKSCRDVYSDFEYKHWTDELARDFIASEYPWFLDTWDGYAFPIMRADAIRYFVLYHYGGIYLDMDTLCNETIPLHQIEADGSVHHAVFKSTKPTGVSNDLLISSQRHPVFAAAISNLLFFNDIARPLAKVLPHVAVMAAAGPFFLTLVIKDWLLEQPSLPTLAVQVVNATELTPFITDLEGCSWHHGDTQTLMWVGDRPWIWFALGAIGLAIGLHVLNHVLLLAFRGFDKMPFTNDNSKVAKLI